MKTLTILAALALLSTGATAKDRCNPATGNWVNAATITCPDTGSGADAAAKVAGNGGKHRGCNEKS